MIKPEKNVSTVIPPFVKGGLGEFNSLSNKKSMTSTTAKSPLIPLCKGGD